ncbi:MAG: hypothetical protein AAFY64_08830 [Pseudomonadota bacterium]
MRLQQFSPACRPYVASISKRSTALEDLAETFPALLVALATGYGSNASRADAFQAVADGQKLKSVSRILGLPWWTRKLGADVFDGGLPRLPTRSDIDLAMANFVPPNGTRAQADWFARVCKAARAGTPDFMVWAARHARAIGRSADDPTFEFACAYAWHSSQPSLPAAQLIGSPFHPDMTPRRVREEVRRWRQRIALSIALENQPRLAWSRYGPATDYRFEALRTTDDFIAESRAMKNCLDRYSGPIETGSVILYSIRRDGRAIADIELLVTDDPQHPIRISQLKGIANRTVGPHVWRAARDWVSHQSARWPRPTRRGSRRSPNAAFAALWGPYRAFIGGDQFASLDTCMRRSAKSERDRKRVLARART